MTDRELLEMAAKVVGYERNSAGPIGPCDWNPLEDDGDALRLAVALNMGISIPVHKTVLADVITFLDSRVNVRQEGDGDPYAATRRAIVRAAAEIGRLKP